VELRAIRIDHQRAADRILGIGGMAALVQQCTEQVQRVRILGFRGQEGALYRLGGVEIAVAMEFQGLLKIGHGKSASGSGRYYAAGCYQWQA
jgi:hypothetical protein